MLLRRRVLLAGKNMFGTEALVLQEDWNHDCFFAVAERDRMESGPSFVGNANGIRTSTHDRAGYSSRNAAERAGGVESNRK